MDRHKFPSNFPKNIGPEFSGVCILPIVYNVCVLKLPHAAPFFPLLATDSHMIRVSKPNQCRALSGAVVTYKQSMPRTVGFGTLPVARVFHPIHKNTAEG